jgi:hypothetical protein
MFDTTRSFILMWLLVIAVSVNDGYWLLANRPIMKAVEQNPLAQWLIHTSGGDIWLLLALKAVGTICVTSILLMLYPRYPHHSWTICAAIAAFQLGLLAYLHLA